MEQQYIDQLIAKVLSREASSGEIMLFNQWLSENEHNRNEFHKVKSFWNADISFDQTTDPEPSLRQIQQKIRKEQQRLSIKKGIRYGISIAASIAIIWGISLFFLLPDKNEPVEYYTYLTDNNKINIVLADSTSILLNKNSKLVYTNQYGKTNRQVHLEGEAYFDVQHNPESPFVIEAGDAQIHVLGTSFNVKIDESANIRTTLAKGSVRFEASGQQVILTPDQQLSYSKDSHKIEVYPVDVDKELAWKEGVVRHKGILFSDLMYSLTQRFHVRILIDNEQLKNSPVSMTGSFAEEQSLEEILKVISISYPFTWEKKDNVYYVK